MDISYLTKEQADHKLSKKGKKNYLGHLKLQLKQLLRWIGKK